MQMLIALDSNRDDKRLLKCPNRGIVVLRRGPTLDFTETKTTFRKLLFNKISINTTSTGSFRGIAKPKTIGSLIV